jgi:hypothetical protein
VLVTARLLRCVPAAAIVGALTLAANIDAASRLVHWQGKHFACWIPNRQWQVTEGANALDISSPTGDEIVSFDYSAWPRLPTLSQVGTLVVRSLGMTNVHLLKAGPHYTVAPGVTQRDVELTAIWQGRTWHAIVTEGTDQRGYSTGFHAYLQLAPADEWRADAATLAFIRDHIVVFG